MQRKQLPEQLFEAITAINSWFRATKVPFVYVGGIAASIHGKPRLTQDVDALIMMDDTQWESFVASAEKFGIAPRISNAISFAKKSRMLLMRHTPTSTDVDIMVGLMPFEETMIRHAVSIRISNTTLRLPKPEDLIIMKSVAGRPKDLEDIRAILDAHPRMNITKLRKTIAELADAVGDSQMLKTFDSNVK